MRGCDSRLASRAELDLDDIWLYVAEERYAEACRLHFPEIWDTAMRFPYPEAAAEATRGWRPDWRAIQDGAIEGTLLALAGAVFQIRMVCH